MLRQRTVIALVCVLLASTGGAADEDCPPVIFTDCVSGFPTGIAWFGLNAQGDNMGVGQSVTFECRTRLLSVEFQFSIQDVSLAGVPPLQPGDEVVMAVLNAAQEPLATTTAVLTAPGPYDQNLQWIYFDFAASGLDLDPGHYILAAATELPRQAGVSYCNYDDDYPAGTRMSSPNGLVGPWSANPDHDLTFRVIREPLPVVNEVVTWSGLKATYH